MKVHCLFVLPSLTTIQATAVQLIQWVFCVIQWVFVCHTVGTKRYMQGIFSFCYTQANNILGHKRGIFSTCSMQAMQVFLCCYTVQTVQYKLIAKCQYNCTRNVLCHMQAISILCHRQGILSHAQKDSVTERDNLFDQCCLSERP